MKKDCVMRLTKLERRLILNLRSDENVDLNKLYNSLKNERVLVSSIEKKGNFNYVNTLNPIPFFETLIKEDDDYLVFGPDYSFDDTDFDVISDEERFLKLALKYLNKSVIIIIHNKKISESVLELLKHFDEKGNKIYLSRISNKEVLGFN